MGSKDKRKGKKSKKKGRQVKNLRQVRIALSQAMLIPDTEFFLTNEQAQKLNEAQKVINSLYKRLTLA